MVFVDPCVLAREITIRINNKTRGKNHLEHNTSVREPRYRYNIVLLLLLARVRKNHIHSRIKVIRVTQNQNHYIIVQIPLLIHNIHV